MIHTLLASLIIGTGVANANPHHHAHNHKIKNHQSHSVVSVGWVWVSGHYNSGKWIRGHWRHPAYGISFKAHRAGPPVSKNHVHNYWVRGHWKGTGKNRHWVPGRWIRR